jgi:peptide deformylase
MGDTVLLLGDPRLRAVCESVAKVDGLTARSGFARLKAALDAFRAERGFGRGIAAPQIGIAKRFIALNLGEGTYCLVNPEITWRSPETFSLWDDCMSFPDLLVRVRRNRSISLRYVDESGAARTWERLGMPESELLQHELDHLDGILAIDRAEGRDAVVYRAAFDADPGRFRALVDYVIEPTIRPCPEPKG